MIRKTCSIIVAITFFSVNNTYASPELALSLNSTSAVTDVGADKTAVQCFTPTVFNSRVADTRSCLQAVLDLPEGSDAGIFHNGDPVDEFKLPVVKKFGPCMATVSLTGSSRDRTSWDHISYVAGQVAAICSNGQFPTGTSGGLIRVGQYRSIRVTVEKSLGGTLSELDALNGTATA